MMLLVRSVLTSALDIGLSLLEPLLGLLAPEMLASMPLFDVKLSIGLPLSIELLSRCSAGGGSDLAEDAPDKVRVCERTGMVFDRCCRRCGRCCPSLMI
jgi:hypothetical protein